MTAIGIRVFVKLTFPEQHYGRISLAQNVTHIAQGIWEIP